MSAGNQIIPAALAALALVILVSCAKAPISNELVNAARDDDLAKFIKLAARPGVNLDAQENGRLGETPLIASTLTQGTNVFLYLLSTGATVDSRDREGKTALMSAVMLGDVNFTKITALIAAGANVNARDKEGASVLKYAKWASAGHVSTNTIGLLEQRGAKE
jgi:ankyrin repeat protein